MTPSCKSHTLKGEPFSPCIWSWFTQLTIFCASLLLDYRHFDAADIEPRFEFGFGLSYTTFNYSNLTVSEVSGQFTSDDLIATWKAGNASITSGEGSSVALE